MNEQFENIIEINEEEMIEFIHSKIHGDISKEVIRAVLDLELDFLKLKGVVES